MTFLDPGSDRRCTHPEEPRRLLHRDEDSVVFAPALQMEVACSAMVLVAARGVIAARMAAPRLALRASVPQRKRSSERMNLPSRTLHYPIVMLNSSMLPWYWSSPSSLRPIVTGFELVIDPMVMDLVNVLPSTVSPI